MTEQIQPNKYTLSMEIEFPRGMNPEHIKRVIKNCISTEGDGWSESFHSNYIHVENFKFAPSSATSDADLDEWCKLHEEILKDIRTEAYRSGFHDGEKCELDKYEKVLSKLEELFIDSDEDTFQCRDCNSIMRKHMIEIRQELS